MSSLAVGRNTLILSLIEITAQTYMYGICNIIMLMAMKTLLQQGLRRGPNGVLLWITSIAFLLMTGYWVLSVAVFSSKMTGSHLVAYNGARVTSNSIMLINFIFADAVVVWRMYILCLLSASVGMTMALRIFSTASQQPVGALFTVVQTCANSLSLATNLAATIIICIWIFQQRHTVQNNFHCPRLDAGARVERLMVLLAESGIVYCISSIILVVGQGIRIPLGGTVGDIYTPVHVQLAGMYPAFVVVLAHSKDTSHSCHACSGESPDNPARPTSFANPEAA